jgi:hypothetical protein
MVLNILAYIIIFIAFAFPVYNIYKILFLKKPLGCASCNSNCELKNIYKLKNNITVDTKIF